MPEISSSEDTEAEIEYIESGESEWNEETESNTYQGEILEKQNERKAMDKKKISVQRKRKRSITEDSNSESELPLTQIAHSNKVKNAKKDINKGSFVIIMYEEYVDPFIDHCYIQKIKHMDHTYSQSMDSSFQSNLNILEGPIGQPLFSTPKRLVAAGYCRKYCILLQIVEGCTYIEYKKSRQQ
ncbi:unnamed protein product [Parnassius apollo]|uniref:(apollo) hypothetical protein n=1 Tax=Parnassius apollo TaxID=110799 RepID=A0A8S3X1L7_PARAO|nr:unnamed protein product [Parnassius apollo]